MSRIKATFYLPLNDDDGINLSVEIAEVERQCFIEFDGWTLVGYFKGAWRMNDGEQSIDTSAVYHVILQEDKLPVLESILLDFKEKAKQEAMYLEVERQIDVRFL